MKTKRSSISRIALRAAAMLLAAALAVFILADMRLAGKPISRLVSGETDFKGFTTEVHDALVSDTVGKYAFVNLNGLYCKLTGRSVCNQIMRLTNGMLTDLNPEKKDMRPAADAIAELSAFSEGEGAQFLYVLSPAKMDAENALRALEGDGFRAAILRPPMVYGDGCKGNYNALRSLARKLPIFPEYENRRSMLYVENLAELIAQLRGDEQAALGVDRVLVFSVHSLSPRSIFIFSTPLGSTSLI